MFELLCEKDVYLSLCVDNSITETDLPFPFIVEEEHEFSL